jgi:hypothetical protein
MKTLIKTDKVIKIDPREVVNLYKFIRRYMQWEPKEYLSRLDKILPNRLENYIYSEIPLDFVILPTYMVSPLPPNFKGIIKPKRRDVIYLENFSYFDLYKVVEDPNGKITDAVVTVGVNYREFEGTVGIERVLLRVEYLRSSFPYQPLFLFSNLGAPFVSEDTLEDILRVLRWAQGRSYSNFQRESSRLMRKLFELEENLTAFLNFLHALHTHKFDGMDMTSWLFKRYSDTIKGLGCNFEDAFSKLIGVLHLLD